MSLLADFYFLSCVLCGDYFWWSVLVNVIGFDGAMLFLLLLWFDFVVFGGAMLFFFVPTLVTSPC